MGAAILEVIGSGIEAIVRFAKQYAIVLILIVGSLTLVSEAVFKFVDLSLLTNLFVFFRHSVGIFDFMFEINSLFFWLGATVSTYLVFLTYKLLMWFIDIFKL